MAARRVTWASALGMTVLGAAGGLVGLSACGATVEGPAPPMGASTTLAAIPTATATATATATGGTGTATPSATPVATAMASATPSATPVVSSGGCPAGMVRIKGGSFKLAAVKTQVSVKDYCLDVNEVTADSYASCVASKGCNDAFVKVCDPSTYGAPGKGNLPMVCVDFPQAAAYCKAQGKRLPTGEEWEWAARGGAEARVYPWGNEAPTEQLCWSGKTTRTGPCPVGSFPGNASVDGVLDLAGNVFEWTTTGNDLVSDTRFGRGGSWRDGAEEVKAGRTGAFKVTYRCGFLGIRCASAAPASEPGPNPFPIPDRTPSELLSEPRL